MAVCDVGGGDVGGGGGRHHGDRGRGDESTLSPSPTSQPLAARYSTSLEALLLSPSFSFNLRNCSPAFRSPWRCGRGWISTGGGAGGGKCKKKSLWFVAVIVVAVVVVMAVLALEKGTGDYRPAIAAPKSR